MFVVTCSIIHLSIVAWKMLPMLPLPLQVTLRPRFCLAVCVHAYTLKSILLIFGTSYYSKLLVGSFFSSRRSFVFYEKTVHLVDHHASIMLMSEFVLFDAISKTFWTPTSFSTKMFVLH